MPALVDKPRTWAQLNALTGGLTDASKMPGPAYSISAFDCQVGSRLREVPNSACSICYAMKHRLAWESNQRPMRKRLALMLADPEGWESGMVDSIARKAAKDGVFRWHVSGDIQSVEHLAAICRIAAATPTIDHWIPTREYRLVEAYLDSGGEIPGNLSVRLSAHMIDGPPPLALAARHPQLSVSTISTDDTVYPEAHHCPSRHQDNACGSCRACWDPDVPHVDYHKH